jgi:hypothetical protein
MMSPKERFRDNLALHGADREGPANANRDRCSLHARRASWPAADPKAEAVLPTSHVLSFGAWLWPSSWG